MKRVVVIDKCEDCPFFNHDDQTVEAKWGKSWCEKQDKELDYKFSKSSIPAECPLDTSEEVVELKNEIERLKESALTSEDFARKQGKEIRDLKREIRSKW